MGKKNTEIRTFEGGVNSDDTPVFLDKNEMLNSINCTISNPYGRGAYVNQTDNAISSMYPRQVTAVTGSLPSGTNTLIGKTTDSRTKTIYLLFHNSLNDHTIIQFTSSGVATVIFRNSFATLGLNWNANLYVSVRLAGNLLIFTDPINGLRFIDVTKTYSIGSVAPNELSYARYCFGAPPSVLRVTNSSLSTTVVQLGTFQFAIRLKDVWGFETILSPLSATSFPPRASQIQATPRIGNTIRCGLNYGMKIPNYWDTIDFIVKDVVNNVYSVYQTFSKDNPQDALAVLDHNALVQFLNATFTGNILYTIDDVTASKLFEATPINSEHIEFQQNRLIAANNTNGYDTPTQAPTAITFTKNTVSCALPTSTACKVYMITTANTDLDEDEYPVYAGLFVWYKGDVWALPKEYSVLRMTGYTTPSNTLKLDNRNGKNYPYLVPTTISETALVKCTQFLDSTFAGLFPNPFLYLETRSDGVNNGFNLTDAATPSTYTYKIPFAQFVWELHELGKSPSGNWELGAFNLKGYNGFSRFGDYTVYITEDAREDTPLNTNRVFLPSQRISFGVRYYDNALRPSSNIPIQDVQIDSFNPFSRTLCDNIQISLTGVNAAPSWAAYFAITTKKNNICTNFLNFAPNCIKVARKDKDGVITVFSDWYNNIKSEELYGLAIPLDSLQQYGLGYAYAQGDSMRLSFAIGNPSAPSNFVDYEAAIIDVQNGHAIISAPQDGSLAFTAAAQMSSQYDKILSPYYSGVLLAPVSATPSLMLSSFRQNTCYATIYQQPQLDNNDYEVAVFGSCISGAWDTFYVAESVSSTFNFTGSEAFTQLRKSLVGNYTGFSSKPNETIPYTLPPIGNYGRVAPIDTIGQVKAINEVRWSNTGNIMPNANFNGLNKFDVFDYALTNYASGAINMILGNLGEVTKSNTLLIICAASGYYTLLEQSFIRSTNGDPTLTASNKFIDNIQELNDKPSTSSPRSFDVSKWGVIWADTLNKKIWSFDDGSVVAISEYKGTRLTQSLFTFLESANLQSKLCGGFNKISGHYILGVRWGADNPYTNLATTNLEYPLNFFYEKSQSYVFDVVRKKFITIIPKQLEVTNIGDKCYAWDSTSNRFDLMFERSNNPPDYDSMVVIPFNQNYDYVKTPLAIKLDASRPPDEVYLQTSTITRFDFAIGGFGDSQVAITSNWLYREGDWYCYVLRDRMSNGTTIDFNRTGLNGRRMKGKVVNVILVWKKEGGSFFANSCSLAYE